MPILPRRRWLRFSLRTMFVAVTLFAVFVAYHVNWIGQRRDFSLRGDVKMNAIHDGAPAEKPWAPGALWLFGENGRESVAVKTDSASWENLSDDDRSHGREARRLFPESRVWLLYDQGGDASRNWVAPLEWIDPKPEAMQ